MVIAQFIVEPRHIVPVTKNQQIHTVYMTVINDDDGYKSDCKANTHKSEGTYHYNANSTVFDTTGDANINREILEGNQYDLNDYAAAATNGKPSILKRQQT